MYIFTYFKNWIRVLALGEGLLDVTEYGSANSTLVERGFVGDRNNELLKEVLPARNVVVSHQVLQ